MSDQTYCNVSEKVKFNYDVSADSVSYGEVIPHDMSDYDARSLLCSHGDYRVARRDWNWSQLHLSTEQTRAREIELVRGRLRELSSLLQLTEDEACLAEVSAYAVANPWVIGPRWAAYTLDEYAGDLLADMADDVDFDEVKCLAPDSLRVRVSGDTYLVMAAGRTGRPLYWGDMGRFEQVVFTMRENLYSAYKDMTCRVFGVAVADELSGSPGVASRVDSLLSDRIEVLACRDMLVQSRARWRDYARNLGIAIGS